MDEIWTDRSRRVFLQSLFAIGSLWRPMLFDAQEEKFSYSYGNPKTPLEDGYIVSTSNAEISFEDPVWFWKPIKGGKSKSDTTPAEIVYHFPVLGTTNEISLWLNMPTFHWRYSQGQNFLYGSRDGKSWEPLAEVNTPEFGKAKDQGTVIVPDTLLGGNDFWLKVELNSFGPVASEGGVYTNTSQLSRYDVNSKNTSFSIKITSAAKPPFHGILSLVPTLLGLGEWNARLNR